MALSGFIALAARSDDSQWWTGELEKECIRGDSWGRLCSTERWRVRGFRFEWIVKIWLVLANNVYFELPT